MSDLETFYSTLMTAVAEQDLVRIRSLIDPAFVIHYDSSLPFGGTYHGVDGFFTFLGRLTESMSDLTTEQLNYMEDANGEQYALIIRLTARARESGHAIDTQVSELWTVRDGKAVEARAWYWGAAGLQLG